MGDVGDVVEMTIDGPAQQGASVGRLPDGRACFVPYTLPGERVRVRVVEQRRRWARAELVEVVEASPDRVVAPCPRYGPGRCGGCALQHVHPRRQTELLGTVVGDQLRRIGRLPVTDVPVVRPHDGQGLEYRQRARFAVDTDGHLAFRRAGSHETIAIDDCPLLITEGRALLPRIAAGWRGTRQVSLQLGDDGRAALSVEPGLEPRGRSATPAVPALPDEVAAGVADRGRRRRATGPTVHVQVDGRQLRVGADAFFQPGTAGAAALVELVVERVAPREGQAVLDCYAGVGLFSTALAARGASVTAVERDRAACRHARHNAVGLPITVVCAAVGPGITLDRVPDVVVLDPPRAGAGPAVMRWIAGLGPSRVVSVSCDPATFARDTRTLVDLGYTLDGVVAVDQFTHTGHVEIVGDLTRRPE